MKLFPTFEKNCLFSQKTIDFTVYFDIIEEV